MKKQISSEAQRFSGKNVASSPPPTTIGVVEIIFKFLPFFKPKLISLFILLSMSFTENLSAGTLTPPTGKLRGMYVSCGNQLIMELHHNSDTYDSLSNLTPAMKQLVNYCTSHYINYIAVYSLGRRINASTSDPIVGNMTYFSATKRFLQVMHDNHIDVGIVITNKEFLETQTNYGTFVTSPFYMDNAVLPWDSSCSMLAKNPTPIIANYSAPLDTLINPSTCNEITCYDKYELSEMLKQIMRVQQYSYWVRDSTIANGCIGCTWKNANTSSVPDLSKYLFNYMSLEYEYWDSTTFMKTTPTGGKTYRKASWNTFYQLSQAMLFVYQQMCNQVKMELELRIDPPYINDQSISLPANPGDTAAQEMLPVSMQVEWLSRAFNRILLSDYRQGNDTVYPRMINKTGNAHTKFADWPNDVNPSNRHHIMPLFSAATAGEYKQCFDTLIYDATAPYDTSEWSDTFFGPELSLNSTMYDFEQMYLDQLNKAITLHRKFNNNQEYGSVNYQDTIDTLGQNIEGFMWFNYSTLRDTFRTVVNYNRYSNNYQHGNNNAYLNFNNQTALLSIFFSSETGEADAQLQVLNTQGELVMLANINKSKKYFYLNYLPPGIYLCRLKQNEKISTKKINILNK